MSRTLGVILLLGIGVYGAACLALFLMQRSFLYFPPRVAAFEAPHVSTLTVPGAVLKVSERPHAGKRAVIYLGGNGEDVSVSLPLLDAAFPDHALYLLHYRGYTGSSGKPTEQALVADSLLLFDRVLAAHPEVVLVGRSLGTGIAVQVASQRLVHRLVLVTPYDSIGELAARQFPYFPVRWLLQDTYDSGKYAPAVKAPTLLIAAEHDEIIPARSTALLLSHFAPGVASMKAVAGAGHNSISDSPTYIPLLQGH